MSAVSIVVSIETVTATEKYTTETVLSGASVIVVSGLLTVVEIETVTQRYTKETEQSGVPVPSVPDRSGSLLEWILSESLVSDHDLDSENPKTTWFDQTDAALTGTVTVENVMLCLRYLSWGQEYCRGRLDHALLSLRLQHSCAGCVSQDLEREGKNRRYPGLG